MMEDGKEVEVLDMEGDDGEEEEEAGLGSSIVDNSRWILKKTHLISSCSARES